MDVVCMICGQGQHQHVGMIHEYVPDPKEYRKTIPCDENHCVNCGLHKKFHEPKSDFHVYCLFKPCR